MAALKLPVDLPTGYAEKSSPWLSRHGRIEASSYSSGILRDSSSLHGYHAMAALKQYVITDKLLEKISLHGYHAMAALKPKIIRSIADPNNVVSMAITPWPH